MDIEVSDILLRAAASDQPMIRKLFQNLLAYTDRFAVAANSSMQDISTRLSVRLLWLLSHSSAASAASHGLQTGYLEEHAAKCSLIPQLNDLAPLLPAKAVLTAWRHNEAKAVSFIGGGMPSSYEKNDLDIFEHKDNADNLLGAALVRYDDENADYIAWVDNIMSRQQVMSHIFILHPDHVTPPIPSAASGWNFCQAVGLAEGWAVDLLTNPQWPKQLAAAAHLKYPEPGASFGKNEKAKELSLPIVNADSFGGLMRLTHFPQETVNGPEAAIYDIREDGRISVEVGRLPALETQERVLYECRNVCVSNIGVIWRQDRVLQDSYIFDQHDAEPESGYATVSEPTLELEGTYFLAPTGNRHHSHLIWETLRKLHYAQSYQPHIKLLASSILTPSQREYFPLYGFPPEKCGYKEPDVTCHVEKLLVSADETLRADRLSVNFMRNIGAKYYDPSAGRPDKIYLSRRDSRIYRNMVNEDEIEAIFESFGFKIILASELSAQQKIETFSTARHLAGGLGAAFTYMPFALDAEMIILTSDLYFPNVFRDTAAVQMNKINYIRGVGLKHYTDPWEYAHSSFYTPPELVTQALKNIFRS